MRIYRISNNRFNIDDFTLKHLDQWLYRVVPYDEIDMAREKILMWISNHESVDVEYALSQGWQKVLDMATSGD
ncbi:MAG: hypothetical protein WD512_09170 [Candidatus Paceibacterota bacterium]